MHRLTDGETDILRELNADARYSERALAELADECDTFETMLCELADADQYDDGGYDRDEWCPPAHPGEACDEMDADYPW